MKIVFKSLKVKNFEGITDLSLVFDKGMNTLVGQNGAGKSNTLDAITWCLFGKDMNDRQAFEVVPLNADNTPKQVEPTVTLDLTVDDSSHSLTRTLKGGSKTEVSIDGAPCKKVSDFNEFVMSVFGSIERFKTFTNPFYFTESLHWKDQRQQLMQFFAMPTKEEILAKAKGMSDDFLMILEDLEPEAIQAKYQKEMSDLDIESEKLKGQLELLDEQLGEAVFFAPEKHEEERRQLREKVKGIQDEIQVASENNRRVAQDKLRYEVLINTADDKKLAIRSSAETMKKNQIRAAEYKVQDIEKELDHLRDAYMSIKRPDSVCPTCGQQLTEEQLAEAEKLYCNQQSVIDAKGRAMHEELDRAKAELKKLQEQEPDISLELKAIDESVAEARQALAELPATRPVPSISDADLKRLDELDKLLARLDENRENSRRRDERAERQKEVFREREAAETILMNVADYMFYRAQIVIDKVNAQFKKISVKILDVQKNGIAKECFEITRNGTPYSNLNSTGQLMAGIELMEFLKSRMDIEAPVLMDNAERYTDFDFTEIPSQVIAAKAVRGKKLGLEYIEPNAIAA